MVLERVSGETKPGVTAAGGEGENSTTHRVKYGRVARLHAVDLATTICSRNPQFTTRDTAETGRRDEGRKQGRIPTLGY